VTCPQRPACRPKLDAWIGTIDQILEEDTARGKKQRHTAQRIFERLRHEHSYTGAGTASEFLDDLRSSEIGRCSEASPSGRIARFGRD
jgi:hypothetical protein